MCINFSILTGIDILSHGLAEYRRNEIHLLKKMIGSSIIFRFSWSFSAVRVYRRCLVLNTILPMITDRTSMIKKDYTGKEFHWQLLLGNSKLDENRGNFTESPSITYI
jgi:hypothetical protein